MKDSIWNGHTILMLGVLVLTSIEHVVAEQADVSTDQCLLAVQETMMREDIKQLYAGDRARVNESCARGDSNTAIRFVERMGAVKSCMRDLDTYIKNNDLDVTREVLNRAMSQCRGGDLATALDEVGIASTQTPAAPAEITSFVANTINLQEGNSAILSWNTTNANTVMLGRYGEEDFRQVQASGSQSVSPDKTTTYVLMVGSSTGGPTAMKSQKLQVTVSTPSTETCSIEGELEGKWRQSIKEHPQGPSSIWTASVGIHIAGSARPFPIAGASVSNDGRYRFEDLTAGNEYMVKPDWASSPEQGYVSCSAGQVHIGPTFTITGSPRID